LSLRFEKKTYQVKDDLKGAKNDQAIEKYKSDLKKHEEQILKNGKKIEKLVLSYKDEFLKKQYQHKLSVSERPSRIFTPNFRGRYELIFLGKLNLVFGSDIKMDLSYGNNGYRPDIAYINSRNNLHVDIEIDEPYFTEHNKVVPIHYLNSDDQRDMFFLSKNWVVIRFCEKQIAKYPDECCKFLKDLIFSIENNQPTKMQNPIFPKWSYEESLIMGSEDYRNTYNSQKLTKGEYKWLSWLAAQEV